MSDHAVIHQIEEEFLGADDAQGTLLMTFVRDHLVDLPSDTSRESVLEMVKDIATDIIGYATSLRDAVYRVEGAS